MKRKSETQRQNELLKQHSRSESSRASNTLSLSGATAANEKEMLPRLRRCHSFDFPSVFCSRPETCNWTEHCQVSPDLQWVASMSHLPEPSVLTLSKASRSPSTKLR